jgi:hypothetical protein
VILILIYTLKLKSSFMAICKSSLFGNTSQYIKVGNGEFVAIEGSSTFDRMGLSDLRMPYKQLLKGRVILKAGQTNYLLNHLGLGDNATFLSIRASYDQKSVNPDNNYIQWSFYDDLTKVHSMAQMMVLTGNGTNRVKQLYLTNPNTNYNVILDVMVGIIDDNYSFFNDTINQSGTSFTNLQFTDIKSHVVGESIKIIDSEGKALIYLQLVTISSIEKVGNILVLNDTSFGTIFLQFKTENDSYQAHSLLNYVLENPLVDIDTISPLEDSSDPIIYWNTTAGVTGSYIVNYTGITSSSPYNTETGGFTFSTSLSLSDWGTLSGTISVFNKQSLINLLVDFVNDDRDGIMNLQPSNLIVTGTAGEVSQIINSGSYSVTFNFSDIAHNTLDGVSITLDVTS